MKLVCAFLIVVVFGSLFMIYNFLKNTGQLIRFNLWRTKKKSNKKIENKMADTWLTHTPITPPKRRWNAPFYFYYLEDSEDDLHKPL